MLVKELKALCVERGLIRGGLKADLIARLEQYDGGQSENDDAQQRGEEEAQPDEEIQEQCDMMNSDESEHSVMLSACESIQSECDDHYNNAEKISTREVVEESVAN